MEIIGVFNNKLYLVIHGPQIIVDVVLSSSNIKDINDYANLKHFASYDDVINAAWPDPQ